MGRCQAAVAHTHVTVTVIWAGVELLLIILIDIWMRVVGVPIPKMVISVPITNNIVRYLDEGYRRPDT